MEAVENGRVVHRYVAIVGDPEHASPEVDAKVVGVNINPTWTVPISIIKNEIIPKMRRDPGYLARQRIRILDSTGAAVDPAAIDWTSQRATNYTLRQDSGKANSLGSIRAAGIEDKIAEGEHEEIRLAKPVPVAWVYMTGWANGDGVAHFRDDVYGIDTVGAATEARVDPQQLPMH